jgi:2-desacetyl-2-hydroxyethyl bacteriochlorophyllide A dehydrogenase
MMLREYGVALEPVDVPVPPLGPDDALVEVRACGVCRTDLKIQKGEIPPPIVTLPHVPGHEAAGEVVEVGASVTGVRPGDRVSVYLYVSCGRCEMCGTGRENLCPTLGRVGFELAGAFAEYVVVPARQLVPVGDMPWEQAAILTDAVVVPYHALRYQAEVAVGDTVLVVGVGGLGVHAVQIARLAGTRVIAADLTAERLELAREHGAHHVVDAGADPLDAVRGLTGGRGVDVVIENVGSPESLEWSLPTLRNGGRLVIVGYVPGRPFPLDTMAMHYHEWEIVGSRLATRQGLIEVVELVNRGDIRPLVTQTFPLEGVNDVLSLLARDAVLGRAVLVL